MFGEIISSRQHQPQILIAVSNCESLSPMLYLTCSSPTIGRVAQLGERGVRNAEVEGSNPFASTNSFKMPASGQVSYVP